MSTRRDGRTSATLSAETRSSVLPFSRVVKSMLCLGVVLFLVLTLGCAKKVQVEEEAEVFLPRHPFPQWVGGLTTGESDAGGVMARFGPPDEIESRARGGQIWRYQLEEIQWPKDDPNRPKISAEGEFKRGPATRLETARDWSQGAAGWLDRTFFFPPRQPRPAEVRMLPAILHRLELVFEADETLSDFRYAPGRGSAQVGEGG